MDHSQCVQVDEFTRMGVHHTHEGQTGWWLFPSEVPHNDSNG
jgi:hypothetical protein